MATKTKRSGILLALLLACPGASSCTHDRPAGSLLRGLQPVPPQPRALGAGVTLAIDKSDGTGPAAKRGIIPMRVTLANHGGVPVRVKYADFSLAGAAERYLALLPSELGPDLGATGRLFPEGVIGAGESRSGLLYFHAPPSRALPVDLRVDLQAANDRPLSETFLPLLAK